MTSSACSFDLKPGRETALVAAAGAEPLVVQDLLERVIDLRAVADGFAESGRALRHDHVFLEIDRRVGMGAAVEHVGERNGQRLRVGPAEIFIERQPDRRGGGVRGGHGDAEDGVRAEVLLGRRAVELEHLRVEPELVGAVVADQFRRDLLVDVLDRLEHALAAVLGLVAVAQFERLVLARAGAGGNDGAAARAVLQDELRLRGWGCRANRGPGGQ